MREPTDQLIEDLARDARPVKPLSPPLARAAVWIAVIVLGFGLIVVLTGAGPEMISRLRNGVYMLELTATFLTGIAATVAATMLTIPGRSHWWALLPLPSAIVWLGCATTRCYQHVAAFGFDKLSPLENVHCFVFIVMVGTPLAIALFFSLRRAAAINFAGVTALGGLGVASLAATLLQFFHPEDTTPVDVATHLAAVAAIIVFMTTLGRGALRRA